MSKWTPYARAAYRAYRARLHPWMDGAEIVGTTDFDALPDACREAWEDAAEAVSMMIMEATLEQIRGKG